MSTRKGDLRAPPAVRLLRNVMATDAGCWQWMRGRTPLGYGKIQAYGKTMSPHRLAYELFVGPIPEGLTLDHLCRNRACANPAHLEPVTMRENTLRGVGPSSRNFKKTVCCRGHVFTPETTAMSGSRRICIACRRVYDQARKAKLRQDPAWRAKEREAELRYQEKRRLKTDKLDRTAYGAGRRQRTCPEVPKTTE